MWTYCGTGLGSTYFYLHPLLITIACKKVKNHGTGHSEEFYTTVLAVAEGQLTSSPGLPGGPAGPRGPTGPLKEKAEVSHRVHWAAG